VGLKIPHGEVLQGPLDQGNLEFRYDLALDAHLHVFKIGLYSLDLVKSELDPCRSTQSIETCTKVKVLPK
jgi:hypothetical protein